MNSRFAVALAVSSVVFSGSGIQAQPVPVPAPPPRMPSGPIEVNGIAAKVNGRVVTKNQVSFMLAPVYAQLVTQYPRRGQQFETKMKEAKSNILQELIDRQIILDEFKQMGATIKPNFIDEEVKRQVDTLYNGSEAKFREELKKNRLTMDGYRDMVREKLTVQAMRSKQLSDAPPPLPNEIQKEYDEVKKTFRDVTKDVATFQKIFIPASDPTNPGAPPEMQLALTEDLVRQIAAGKDFGELAKANSKDAFAADGGLQKDVKRTDLSAEFAAILFDKPVGELIGPLLDPQGFTIVKTVELKLGPPPPLDDKLRKVLEERVARKKTSAQYDKWIEGRRKKAMITIMD